MHTFIDNIITFSLRNKFFIFFLYHDRRNRRYHQLYPYADRCVSGCDEYEGDDYHPMAGQERRGDREVYHDPDRDRHEPGTEKDGYPEHDPFRSFRHQRDVRR